VTVVNETSTVESLINGRVRVPASVVFRTFIKETVVLNLDTGHYHGLNPTGGRMLSTLEELGSVREAAARIATEFDIPVAQAEADVCQFCHDLVDRGLLTAEA
jgi:hypothetical protein